MRVFKLWHHKINLSDESLVINPKEFPGINVNDVVEIYPVEDEFSRLLLQVKSLKEDPFQQKVTDVISVAISIATKFGLRMYKDVCVNVVDTKNVALDLVELTYKEQYFSRADMWRLRKSLINSCLFLSQKNNFAEMRSQVEELWSKGDKVTCGYVTSDTRVTFRSSTAQVNIFIQMSREMWDFDNYGDLYFEKAVDGFLVDLFKEWKEKNCNHDVTITMFSRTFYDASCLEEFPMHMRECVQLDHSGRFYEDFYRVVVQNERYDDWTSSLMQLKQLFSEYPQRVLHYHQQSNLHVPRAYNSTAAQGNILEVINLALNVFEKYFLDRCFDRTGKLSLVITPGPGIFEVDRDLSNITKHRTIDCGNSSDLVCMGEQPLHAVPLFKFINKNPAISDRFGEDYSIPHWINHSFYTSKSQAQRLKQGKFVPRIRNPLLSTHSSFKEENIPVRQSAGGSTNTVLDNDMPFVNYEEHDAAVFSPVTYKPKERKDILSLAEVKIQKKHKRRVQYSNVKGLFHSNKDFSSECVDIPTSHASGFLPHSFTGYEREAQYGSKVLRPVFGSCDAPFGHHTVEHRVLQNPCSKRTLINPFAPPRLHFKVTSNRRRWVHAFPTDLQGASVQLHHTQNVTFAEVPEKSDSDQVATHVIQAAQLAVESRMYKTRRGSESSDYTDMPIRGKSVTISSADSIGSSESMREMSVSFGRDLKRVPSSSALSAMVGSVSSTGSGLTMQVQSEASSVSGRSRTPAAIVYSRSSSNHCDMTHIGEEGHNWLWGITGEQEWTPEVQTGMDWKSMTMPASLPMSTDYFPDKRSLQLDYVISDYSLLPEVMTEESARSDGKHSLTTMDVYKEMIAQRLAQGFQIVLPKSNSSGPSTALSSSPYQAPSVIMARAKIEPTWLQTSQTPPREDIILSIGRIYHMLTRSGPNIKVTRYWPKHPYQQKFFHYTYRFQVPDSQRYDVSWTDFRAEKLETYKWNHVDQYLCTRGEEDFGLMEALKYWRSRFFLIPCNNPATKKIIDGAPRCDIYEERSFEEQQQLVEGFIRFIEMLNRLRRPLQTRMHKREMVRRTSLTQSPCPSVPPPSVLHKMHDVLDSPPVGSIGQPSPLTNPTDAHHRKPNPSSESGRALHVAIPGAATPATKAEVITASDQSVLPQLSTSSSPCDIVEAMLDPNEGVHLTRPTAGLPYLPPNTFIAMDALVWARSCVEGAHTHVAALQLMQRLLDENFIAHASGHGIKFVVGFYFYCITDKDKKGEAELNPYLSTYCMYLDHFQHDWCEVAVHLPEGPSSGSQVPFLQATLPRKLQYEVTSLGDWEMHSGQLVYSRESPSTKSQKSTSSSATLELPLDLSSPTGFHAKQGQYKMVNVDVDPAKKSDREEWGTAHYHANYTPTAAFELTVEWLVATGCILGDLTSSWARKAGSSGYHFLPVPGDPFALPFTPNSDPLRGPIFVPLTLDCLVQPEHDLFEDFSAHTREERLLLFQDSILRRFGFMPDRCPITRVTNVNFTSAGSQLQYVHCSGGMFAMIPDTKTSSPRNQDGTHRHVTVGSYHEYIAIQCICDDQPSAYYQVGFLWSWNYMLTKRWRSPNTGDECFQDKMLEDFRAFCSNENNRLNDYWHHCQSVLETSECQIEEEALPKQSISSEVTASGPKVMLQTTRDRHQSGEKSEPKDIPVS